MTPEKRFTPAPGLRADASNQRFISGYAALFNKQTDIGGMFIEQIKPGAFARAIREKQDVRALLNHDANLVLGRTANSTLSLKEDARGLWFRCDVAPTSAGNDVLAMVRRNDIGECSFGFSVVTDEWASTQVNGKRCDLRTLVDVNLFDVSPVTYAAYSGTNVELNSEVFRMFPVGSPQAAPAEVRSRIERASPSNHPKVASIHRMIRSTNDPDVVARCMRLLEIHRTL